MTEEQAKIWAEGFKAGVEQTERKNAKEIRIGKVILDVMYETFEIQKEDY